MGRAGMPVAGADRRLVVGERVVVTGADGFIGCWSSPAVVAAGYNVHAVVSHIAGCELRPQSRGARADSYAPTVTTRPGAIWCSAKRIPGICGVRSAIRLEQERTTTMPNGSIFMFCWNSRLRSGVTNTSHAPFARRSNSPFLMPAQP